MAESPPDRTINYIELAVTDMTRAKRFYGAAFGWTFTDFGPDYCEFYDGRMKGGFDANTPVRPGGPLVVLYSHDLDELSRRIAAAGGVIVKPVFDFLSIGIESGPRFGVQKGPL